MKTRQNECWHKIHHLKLLDSIKFTYEGDERFGVHH